MTTNAREEKWSEWKSHDGKSVPLSDDYDFEYETRNGSQLFAFSIASKYKNEFLHAQGGNDIIAYRYKIKDPESAMHPDLEWLARNVSEWGGDDKFSLIIKDCGHDDYIDPKDKDDFKTDNNLESFSYNQWLQARKDLGLIMSDAEEEMRAEEWNGYVNADDEPDNVNKPKHYQLREGYEVYDLRQDLAAKAANGGATYDQYSDWDRAIEYIVRMWGKNRLEDAKKGRWYLDKLIGKLEAQE